MIFDKQGGGQLIVIKGIIRSSHLEDLRRSLPQAPGTAGDDIVINCLPQNSAVESVVTIRGDDPRSVSQIANIVGFCGIKVRSLKPVPVNTWTNLSFYTSEEEQVRAEKVLRWHNIQFIGRAMGLKAIDLSGNKVPYVEVYCDDDDVKKKIERFLGGQFQLEMHLFVPDGQNPSEGASKPPKRHKPRKP